MDDEPEDDELCVEYETEQYESTTAILATTADFFRVTVNFLHAAEDVAAMVRASAEENEGQRVACKAGCSWCCHQPVEVSAGEVLVVALATLALEDAGMEAFWDRVADHENRLACPALGPDGRCSIYPVRPAMCRAADSFDAGICKAALSDPKVPGRFSEASELVACRGAGHILALEDRGFDSRIYVLAPTLAAVGKMGLPEAERRWRAGQPLLPD
ncbi:YkgJ family cysteine cluster protein [Roseomonas sp. NAR14]|uniref:YkgJ family cysteine cluster protein n=1 Tax=Roseomonas acroporae TaxID=2937791 RepID=A0A9X1YCZ3_9PROT|nr:YkgJ family cysteine cluster protein [Roseomonas acroporae]MCK8784261.1 YkgJ family cysteine cluster protein [Roseomonas acroporae]